MRLGLAGVVALILVVVGSASAASMRQPPCTKRALAAGLQRGTQHISHGRIDRPWGCAGQFAYSGVEVPHFQITVLFRAQGARWVTASRAKYCKGTAVPKRIRRAACDTN